MAGGIAKYRHLSRSSAHRQALLRNLVTSLIRHEHIRTTWPKAKEAQRLAEKIITLGKRNTAASRRRAESIFYTPHELLPKLFGPLRERYANRPGGYTRVLRMEPMKADQAPSAILELVDGPRDIRFAMTARTLAKLRLEEEESAAHEQKKDDFEEEEDEAGGREGGGREKGEKEKGWNEITARNVRKVTRYRPDGEEALQKLVRRFESLGVGSRSRAEAGSSSR